MGRRATIIQKCGAAPFVALGLAFFAALVLVPGHYLAIVICNPAGWANMEPLAIAITVVLCILLVLLFSVGAYGVFALVQLILASFGLITIPKDKLSRTVAADIIDQFIENNPKSGYEWDDFVCIREYEDRLVQEAADECSKVHDLYPARKPQTYCNDEGMNRLREIRDRLRSQVYEPKTAGGGF